MQTLRLLPILPRAGDSICARGAPEAAGIESFGVAKGVAVEPEGQHDLRDDANAQHHRAQNADDDIVQGKLLL